MALSRQTDLCLFWYGLSHASGSLENMCVYQLWLFMNYREQSIDDLMIVMNDP